MTKEALKAICKKTGGYGTAYLNDKLYAHYKGFAVIQSLEEYTALKVLWLEGNGLRRIEGLDKQTDLMTLYLHENVIDCIENLDSNVSWEGRAGKWGRRR